MYNRESALRDILSCIEIINDQLPPDEKIAKADDTVLAGVEGVLESLTLVTLMVEIEEAVEEGSGVRVPILEEAVMHEDGARFSTVADLARWIAEQI